MIEEDDFPRSFLVSKFSTGGLADYVISSSRTSVPSQLRKKANLFHGGFPAYGLSNLDSNLNIARARIIGPSLPRHQGIQL